MEQNPSENISDIEFALLKSSLANLRGDDLLQAKQSLAYHFAQKATEEIDRLWDEKGWNNATMQEWLNSDT